MSRVIKFRVWRKEDNEFIYAEPVYGFFASLRMDEENGNNLEERYGDIQQFTGLLDKNGKEIYEGDIVRCFDTSGEKVYDHEVDFFVFREEIWSEEVGGYTKVEIIGNVFESPELLTPTK